MVLGFKEHEIWRLSINTIYCFPPSLFQHIYVEGCQNQFGWFGGNYKKKKFKQFCCKIPSKFHIGFFVEKVCAVTLLSFHQSICKFPMNIPQKFAYLKKNPLKSRKICFIGNFHKKTLFFFLQISAKFSFCSENFNKHMLCWKISTKTCFVDNFPQKLAFVRKIFTKN